MRKSELFHLQWSDVDFVANTITVQGKADWHTKNYDFRTIGMTRLLRETLEIVDTNRDRYQPHVLTSHGEATDEQLCQDTQDSRHARCGARCTHSATRLPHTWRCGVRRSCTSASSWAIATTR